MNVCIKALTIALQKKYTTNVKGIFKVQAKTLKPRDAVLNPVLARRQAVL